MHEHVEYQHKARGRRLSGSLRKLFLFLNYIYILCGFRGFFFPLRENLSNEKFQTYFFFFNCRNSSHFINKNTRNERPVRNSSRSKFNHPFFILLQVCGRDRLSNFLKSQFEVSSGHRHLKLLFRKRTDLFWT